MANFDTFIFSFTFQKKFGGDGKIKNPCLYRRCPFLKPRYSHSVSSPSTLSPQMVLRQSHSNRTSPIYPSDTLTNFKEVDQKKTFNEGDIHANQQIICLVDETTNSPAPTLSQLSSSPPKQPPLPPPLQPTITARTTTGLQASRTWLYGRELPHLTESICAACFGKRSQELEDDPILFCDWYVCCSIV
jgi:hypothetical protein